MKIKIRFPEDAFVVFTLILFSEIKIFFIPERLILAGQLLNYAITLILIAVHWKRMFFVATRDKLLLLFVVIALASFLWSNVPTDTLRRSLYFLGTTLCGVYLAARYSWREQLRLLGWTLGILVVLTILYCLAFPSHGIMTGEFAGAWQGIFGQKNRLGRMMTLTSVVFLLIAMNRSRYYWIGWAGFGLAIILIVLSTSKTALVVFLTLVIFLRLSSVLRWNYTLAVPFFMFVVLVGGSAATLLIGNAEAILHSMGRDLTLTGRSDLWAALLDKLWQHPWLGYGYSSFWRAWGGESGYIWLVIGWQPTQAHNGFLDVALQLGLLGLFVLTLGYVLTYLKAITWVRLTKTAEGYWPLMFLIYFFLSNLTEGPVIQEHTLGWVLYVSITLSTCAQHAQMAKSGAFTKYQERERLAEHA